MSEKENNQNIKNENSNLDVDMDDILDIMGSRTRREIINLLREEPMFVSEISNQLNIGQKAGILKSSYKKIMRGRPRKYYDMPNDITVNIIISQNIFDVNVSEDRLNQKQLPSGDEWSRLLDLEKKIDQGHYEAVRELEGQIRLYKNLLERAEYILERTFKERKEKEHKEY